MRACCCRWPGVLCCKTAQHVHDLLADLLPYAGGHGNLSCARDTDVAGLFLSAAGLTGSLPIVLGELPGLRTLILGHNPGLHGAWPRSLQLPQLLFLDVQVRQWPANLHHNNCFILFRVWY